jgi:hypothetical protein
MSHPMTHAAPRAYADPGMTADYEMHDDVSTWHPMTYFPISVAYQYQRCTYHSSAMQTCDLLHCTNLSTVRNDIHTEFKLAGTLNNPPLLAQANSFAKHTINPKCGKPTRHTIVTTTRSYIAVHTHVPPIAHLPHQHTFVALHARHRWTLPEMMNESMKAGCPSYQMHC